VTPDAPRAGAPATPPSNRAQRVGRALQRVPLAYGAAVAALRLVGTWRRPRQIARYLETHERRYLRIGSGRHTGRDWLSTDLIPVSPRVVYMDATEPFPLPSRSFEAVHCEHVIEHITYDAGLTMLRECHRILRPGGVLRIATPDLALVARLITSGSSDQPMREYVEWSNGSYGTESERRAPANAAFAANRLVRAWGHTFIYDEPTLHAALRDAGFHDVVRVAPGASDHAALRGVDHHHEEIGTAANELETLAFEATA
jgi:predicted SAM-dependent methyltransferase